MLKPSEENELTIKSGVERYFKQSERAGLFI